MNYIELLTQEEKVNLCGIMGGRDFKELFKHNEREGFRAKSLTEELALSIAIAKRSTVNMFTFRKSPEVNIPTVRSNG